MSVGVAQKLLTHAEMDKAKDLGARLRILIAQVETRLDIDRIFVGVDSTLSITWFRFQGKLR